MSQVATANFLPSYILLCTTLGGAFSLILWSVPRKLTRDHYTWYSTILIIFFLLPGRFPVLRDYDKLCEEQGMRFPTVDRAMLEDLLMATRIIYVAFGCAFVNAGFHVLHCSTTIALFYYYKYVESGIRARIRPQSWTLWIDEYTLFCFGILLLNVFFVIDFAIPFFGKLVLLLQENKSILTNG